MQATGALSWRRADVKYRKNEAFVDVIEDVNLLMSAGGNVLRADVSGQIIMRAYLSGTPECKFGLNDRLLLDGDALSVGPSQGSGPGATPRAGTAGTAGTTTTTKATRAAAGSVTLEDCQFHQCVKLGKFDTDRIISFVPPDGEFELMRYRATENVNLPFRVHAIVNEIGKTKVEYQVAIRANYGTKLFATNVVVRVPTPLNTAGIQTRTSQGKAKYEPAENHILWKSVSLSPRVHTGLTTRGQNTKVHRPGRIRPQRRCDADVHDQPEGLVAPAAEPLVQPADVYLFRAAGAVSEGV